MHRLGGGDQPPGALLGRGRELGRALEERTGRRGAATPRGRGGGALEVGGDGLVGAERGPARCQARRSGSRSIDVACASAAWTRRRSSGCGRVVGRRAHERVAELHARADAERAVGGVEVLGREIEGLGGAPQQLRVAGGIGGRDEQQQARGGGERLQLGDQARLDALLERDLGRAERARQFLERERVPARLGDQLVAHARIDHARERAPEQLARGIVAEAFQREPRQIGERVADGAHRQHQRDPLGVEAAGDERERLRGGGVEPLRVVDDAQQPAVAREVGEQAEHGETDQERARRGLGAQAECGLERGALGCRQAAVGVQQVTAEQLQPRVGQLHLVLGGDDPPHLDAGRRRRGGRAARSCRSRPRRTRPARCCGPNARG